MKYRGFKEGDQVAYKKDEGSIEFGIITHLAPIANAALVLFEGETKPKQTRLADLEPSPPAEEVTTCAEALKDPNVCCAPECNAKSAIAILDSAFVEHARCVKHVDGAVATKPLVIRHGVYHGPTKQEGS